MLRILSCAPYKDCSQQDFNHYFHDTFLVFHLTDTKTRIFTPEQIDGPIIGQYLTRLKEWKPLQIKWEKWWERLSIIAPFPISFNLGVGAGLWTPNISKTGPASSGYRKSFPNLNNQGLKLYGKIDAKDKVQQNVVYTVFKPVYKDTPYFPTLADELRTDRTATACRGDFIVNRAMKQVLYKGYVVGKYDNGHIVIPGNLAHLRDFMIKSGAAPAQIVIQ